MVDLMDISSTTFAAPQEQPLPAALQPVTPFLMAFSFLVGVATTLACSSFASPSRRKSLSFHRAPRSTRNTTNSKRKASLPKLMEEEFEDDDCDDEFEAFINSMPHLRRLRKQWSEWRDRIERGIQDGSRNVRRSLWPWREKRRARSHSPPRKVNANDMSAGTMASRIPSDKATVIAADSTKSSHPSLRLSSAKSGLCIGSIFGMDVGGTLAKLVYFEKKPPPDDLSSTTAPVGIMADASVVATVSTFDGGGGSDASTRPGVRKRSHSFTVDLRRVTSTAIYGRKRKEVASLERGASMPSMPTEKNEVAWDGRAVRAGIAGEDDIDDSNNHQNNSSELPSAQSDKESTNMLELSERRRCHAKALDYFYHVARTLDTYRVGRGVRDEKLSFYSRELGGEFQFVHFETRNIQVAMDLIKAHELHLNICEMGCTGGGAHKFAKIWKQELGIEMKRQDELDSLVAGLQFLLSTVVGECYTFRPQDEGPAICHQQSQSNKNILETKDGAETKTDPAPSITTTECQLPKSMSSATSVDQMPAEDSSLSSDSDNASKGESDHGQGDEWWWSRKVQKAVVCYSSSYPYLLVTIGTGVSILRVDGPRQFERVSGSTIGGGTYWGLMRLLTSAENYEDVINLAERGDPSKVDMAVGDIYGKNSEALEKIGLPSNIVASSFGKLGAMEDPAADLNEEDLARALLLMITNNIGLVSYLNAKLCNTNRIYFVGNFLRRNKISQRRLAYAINYWSKGEFEALFLEHEGYFGALGAFLLNQTIQKEEEGGEDDRCYDEGSEIRWDGTSNSSAAFEKDMTSNQDQNHMGCESPRQERRQRRSL